MRGTMAVVGVLLSIAGCSSGPGSGGSATPLSVVQLKVELNKLAAKLKCPHAAFHDGSDDTKGGVSASACYPPASPQDTAVRFPYTIVMFPTAKLRDAWVTNTQRGSDADFVKDQTAGGGYWAVLDPNSDAGKPVIEAVGGKVVRNPHSG